MRRRSAAGAMLRVLMRHEHLDPKGPSVMSSVRILVMERGAPLPDEVLHKLRSHARFLRHRAGYSVLGAAQVTRGNMWDYEVWFPYLRK